MEDGMRAVSFAAMQIRKVGSQEGKDVTGRGEINRDRETERQSKRHTGKRAGLKWREESRGLGDTHAVSRSSNE